MADKIDLSLVLQIINGMDDASQKLVEAYNNKDMRIVGAAKKEILMFQKKLSEEIGG